MPPKTTNCRYYPGVCSNKTLDLFWDEKCFPLIEHSQVIFNTFHHLYCLMCDNGYVDACDEWIGIIKPFNSLENSISKKNASAEFSFRNTQNRYPWICSLRSKGRRSRHYCAVTLLSRAPGPTVLVGPAHCTFLCKSSRGVVNNCCCGGPNDCSDVNERCGTNPRVVKLTGSDADILCGEWETGDTPPTASGEKYNIVLNIKEIIRHPDFTVNLNGSIYIQNDIAVFKVDDTVLSKVSQISKHLNKVV